MTYSLQDDIEDGVIDSTRVDALNREMSAVTNRLVLRADERRDLDPEFNLVLQFLLKSFPTTHESMIAILRHGNEAKLDGDKSKPAVTKFGPDAMLLARDQLEKVFTVTLLLSDPIKWFKIYSQDDWRRQYEKHLYEKSERLGLDRFTDFHENTAPEALERLRTGLAISDKQKEWIEHKYNDPGTKPPDHLLDHKVPEFPTAGKARTELIKHESAPMLERLHKEYKYLSGYAHSGAVKMFAQGVSDRRIGVAEEMRDRFFQNEILGPSIVTSYCSSAAACTEVFKYLGGDVDLIAALTKQWEHLNKVSLLAKALWGLRGSKVLAFGFGPDR
ncbi:MAG: hypothetical protein AB7J13_04105 [Pyrinomonadaceae bacterium]